MAHKRFPGRFSDYSDTVPCFCNKFYDISKENLDNLFNGTSGKGYLYSCEFIKNEKSRIQVYKVIKKKTSVSLSKVGSPYTLPVKNVQGLAFYHKDNTVSFSICAVHKNLS